MSMTVDLPDELADRLAAAAAERGVTLEALVVEAVEAQYPVRRRPSFVGIGRSGRSDTSERYKEIRRQAFADKTARRGIRVGDLLDREGLLEKLEQALEFENAVITRVYGHPPVSRDEVYAECAAWADRLTPFICQTELLINRALREGKEVLLEGAQGTLLDLDFGTYPYVTSSHPGAPC
jgi:adenylosuccinate synthase